ncbi:MULTISPECIES: XdhC family protein [unclassified Undibacterium]|uniref:XdhC family protein n=2 Tax=Undibacterium TaxID=401469 RepID=UPI002AC9DF72|nr:MULTISPECIES: XdhC family protein [unclassified Undibacterium]MEB0139747.1 XdhC family protein [Undibacterium sp. CCC2.1]MEB0172628.1 XdhC family protein [Undibacterium sp. CCC1.1]MEB0176391.1 XdhC family protein [Undibacterium sp. CCC3.4]MEB0215751.1 XdhC family protein [Undibacterium sp. 5I2]WPX45172.1 XdhC family protein [Undibacterium sp. CCC3.4]
MEDLDTTVLRTALSWQVQGLAVLLVTVARTWGSSPRPPGSLMAINQRGATVGSVSGGCIEDDLIERMQQAGIAAICQNGLPAVLRYGVSSEQAQRFGLPCGGTIELVLEPLSAHSQIEALLHACQQRLSIERTLDLQTGHTRLRHGVRGGVPRLDEQQLVSYLGPQIRLIVIGASDLSRFLCQFALAMGFEVIVCDPREEYRAAWQLDGVAVSAEMPDDLIQSLVPDARTAIIALSHDPKLDDLALIDALQSEAFYVGAIGSRRNSAQRHERLRTHFDLSETALQALHGPAGLYIGSRTPAEIALSIMAQVVAIKNGVPQLPPTQVAAGKVQQAQEMGIGAPL